MTMRSLTITGALVVAALGAGCTLAPVEPWQKGNLAKRSMQFDGDPADDKFTQHIYSSKENSSGGYGVGGGGCGCN